MIDSRFNRFHWQNWLRMTSGAFGRPHGKFELLACTQEEIGELARAVLRVEGEKTRTPATREEVLDAIADAMTYLSLLASAYNEHDLERLLCDTFDMVSDRAGSPIKVGPPNG
jgi:NTP pyrophosphatase (non-canonical NTP hydrolase)